jgi:hypothetical protein
MFFRFIIQVALGKSNELLHANNNAHQLPTGLQSVKGVGAVAPHAKNAIKM